MWTVYDALSKALSLFLFFTKERLVELPVHLDSTFGSTVTFFFRVIVMYSDLGPEMATDGCNSHDGLCRENFRKFLYKAR